MRKKSMIDLRRISAEEFKQAAKIPLIVVLDNVRSEMNVGSMFRTADAFVVERIVLCGITATPPLPEIHKTALGAEDSVDWTYSESALQAVNELRCKGYKIYSVEQVHGSISLEQFIVDPCSKYAVVLGNEVKGVSQDVVDASDGCIEIPQCGTKHSLNVANTGAIIMWNFFKSLHL